MKLLRLGFLVLLALLLPIRGALAATMPCAPAAGKDRVALLADASPSPSRHAAPAHDHALAHDEHAQAVPGVEDAHSLAVDENATHDHGGAAHGHDAPVPDKCNVCSASCSSPPLPSASASIDEPVALASVSYPSVSAPAPTFHSDGQERPPRTC